MEGASDNSYGAPSLADKMLLQQDLQLRIESAARKAFDSFFFEKNNQSRSGVGCMYEEHRNWKSFLEIGRICVTNGFDPSDYVSTIYRTMAANGGIVLPSNITNATAVAFYKKEKSRQAYKPEEMWNSNERIVAELVADGRSEKQVLMNPMLSLAAWFRVLYPEQADDDIIKTYGKRAIEELESGQELMDFAMVKNSRTVDHLLSTRETDRPDLQHTRC